MLRFGIVCMLIIGHSADLAMANETYSPPPVGAQITWSVPTDTGTETRVSEVVANGPDFAIYLYDLKWDPEDSGSYFVEFSGLHSSVCAAQMPTQEKRRELSALWPLKQGDEIAFEAESGVAYEIKEPTLHAISQADGTKEAQVIAKHNGNLHTKVTLSLTWKMPVREEWEDGWTINALDVFIPPRPEKAVDAAQLGNCSALLQ